ncbi:Unknown protein, partial [Striga hermonthica]
FLSTVSYLESLPDQLDLICCLLDQFGTEYSSLSDVVPIKRGTTFATVKCLVRSHLNRRMIAVVIRELGAELNSSFVPIASCKLCQNMLTNLGSLSDTIVTGTPWSRMIPRVYISANLSKDIFIETGKMSDLSQSVDHDPDNIVMFRRPR